MTVAVGGRYHNQELDCIRLGSIDTEMVLHHPRLPDLLEDDSSSGGSIQEPSGSDVMLSTSGI